MVSLQPFRFPIVAAFSICGTLAALSANPEYDSPPGYYVGTEGLWGDRLKTALHVIIRGHRVFPYSSFFTDTWDILKDADQDPDNAANVLLIYNGASVNAAQEYNGGNGWNREHVWPKSLGGFDTLAGPGTDAHNLRACRESVNVRRGNLEFDYGGWPVAVGGVVETYADGNSFEPNNGFKGDVARIIFYMVVRYEGGFEIDLETDDFTDGGVFTFGRLSSLMEWHRLDPVDEFERRRNSRIYFYQGNRNPFIDRPEFAAAVFEPQSVPTPTPTPPPLPEPSPEATPQPTPQSSPTPPVDRSPPTLRVRYPENSAAYTLGRRLTFRGAASDDRWPTAVQFRVKSPSDTAFGPWQTVYLRDGEAKVKGWSHPLVFDRRGDWTVRVRALDARRNPSAVRTITVTRE